MRPVYGAKSKPFSSGYTNPRSKSRKYAKELFGKVTERLFGGKKRRLRRKRKRRLQF